MGFLERDGELAALDAALVEARAGNGRLVLVSGEAGIGKTTLVREFLARTEGVGRAVVACDGLEISGPFGPP